MEKEAGGVILAQDPNDAEYSGMPESAIATGVVDFVAPVADLGAKVAQVLRSKEALRQTTEQDAEQGIRQIVSFLRLRTGHDFSNYKRATILRRVARRMQVTRQDSFADYYRYLHSQPREVQELFSDLLISVTMFFRDPQAFAALAEKVVSPLFDKLDGNSSMRVWVVGCATGEEAYSIGMLLLEEASRRGVHPLIQIFATEVGTLFLDLDFKIKLFTPPVTRYFNITDPDVGRPISNFTHQLDYSDLERDAANVLKTLMPIEKEISTSDGQWSLMRMRPYRTLENQIDGVVVTFSDVTRLKLAEAGLGVELRAMTSLQQLSTKVAEADRVEAPLTAILDAMIELLGADFGHIQLYDESSRSLRISADACLTRHFFLLFCGLILLRLRYDKCTHRAHARSDAGKA